MLRPILDRIGLKKWWLHNETKTWKKPLESQPVCTFFHFQAIFWARVYPPSVLNETFMFTYILLILWYGWQKNPNFWNPTRIFDPPRTVNPLVVNICSDQSKSVTFWAIYQWIELHRSTYIQKPYLFPPLEKRHMGNQMRVWGESGESLASVWWESCESH